MSLVHADYLKVSRRKLYPVMVGMLTLFMGFIGLLFYVLLPALPEAAGAGMPVPQKPGAFVFGAQQVASQAWWFAVILATALLGGEMSTTAWATGLTRESAKTAQIGARFVVFTIASWLAFVAATAMWSAVTWFAADGSGSPRFSEWLGLGWRFGVIAAAWTSIGLGAVAETRSIALGMGVALGLAFVDSLVAPFVDFYEQISLTAASNGIFQLAGDGLLSHTRRRDEPRPRPRGHGRVDRAGLGAHLVGHSVARRLRAEPAAHLLVPASLVPVSAQVGSVVGHDHDMECPRQDGQVAPGAEILLPRLVGLDRGDGDVVSAHELRPARAVARRSRASRAPRALPSP
jgi:hypothetical protein